MKITKNKYGFIDGGFIIVLAVAAISAIIVSRETVSRETVESSQPFAVDNTVYKCDVMFEYRPVRVYPDQPVIIKKKLIPRKLSSQDCKRSGVNE